MKYKLLLNSVKFVQLPSIMLQPRTLRSLQRLPTPVSLMTIRDLNIHNPSPKSSWAWSPFCYLTGIGALIGTGINSLSHRSLSSTIRYIQLPKLSVTGVPQFQRKPFFSSLTIPEVHDTENLGDSHISSELQKIKEKCLNGLQTTCLPQHLKDVGICIPIQLSISSLSQQKMLEGRLFFLFDSTGRVFVDYSFFNERHEESFELIYSQSCSINVKTLIDICREVALVQKNEHGIHKKHLMELSQFFRADTYNPKFATNLSIEHQDTRFSGIFSEVFLNKGTQNTLTKPNLTCIDPRVYSDINIYKNRFTGDTSVLTGNLSTTLSLLQTLFARALLYYPKPFILNEFSRAATGLQKIWFNLDSEERLGFVTRLFGVSGFLPQKKMILQRRKLLKSSIDKQSQENIVEVADIKELGNDLINQLNSDTDKILLPIFYRVIKQNCSAHDRAVIIALLGDIGALFDLGGASGTDRSLSDTKKLRRAIFFSTKPLHIDESSWENIIMKYFLEIKSISGSKALAPFKKDQRGFKKSDESRTGVHNLGSVADSLLNVTAERLVPTVWDINLISEMRISPDKEPFVGHMSGSPFEIFIAWELLSGGSSDIPTFSFWKPTFFGKSKSVPGLDFSQPEHSHIRSRSSATTSFLIASGFHSAVEVLSSILVYHGQDSREFMKRTLDKDAANVFGNGAATDLICEMLAHGIDSVELTHYLEDLRIKVRRFSHSSSRKEEGFTFEYFKSSFH